MKTTVIEPYLFFGGRCEEALEFYRTTLGAKLDFLMRYKESPQPISADAIPAGDENKILHATFRIGGSTIMASDGSDNEPRFGGFCLSLALPTETEAKRVFTALAVGGQVTMPLAKTFWSPCFGMLSDRFGLGWMVTVMA